jgi:hypothetical protein
MNLETATTAEIVTDTTGLRSGPYFEALVSRGRDLVVHQAKSKRQVFSIMARFPKRDLVAKLTETGPEDLYYRQLMRLSKKALIQRVWDRKVQASARKYL